jgi:hypothetical protein
MKRSVTISLGEFAFEALADKNGTGSEHVPARLSRAIRCYLEDADAGPTGWRHPAFAPPLPTAERTQVEMSVDEEVWRALAEEAESQGISIEQMVDHAALYFAAELDTGRITERILEDLDDEPRGGAS